MYMYCIAANLWKIGWRMNGYGVHGGEGEEIRDAPKIKIGYEKIHLQNDGDKYAQSLQRIIIAAA